MAGGQGALRVAEGRQQRLCAFASERSRAGGWGAGWLGRRLEQVGRCERPVLGGRDHREERRPSLTQQIHECLCARQFLNSWNRNKQKKPPSAGSLISKGEAKNKIRCQEHCRKKSLFTHFRCQSQVQVVTCAADWRFHDPLPQVQLIC